MDPILLGIVNSLTPAFVLLALATIPIGIIWLNKSHQLRMKELELDAQRMGGATPAQLAAIEARLAAIEEALPLPQQPQNALAGRAALLEGPATAQQEPPARVR